MVLKQLRSGNFTTLPNELLRDRRLRWNDIGLLAQMLSRPPNWNFNYSGLYKDSEGNKLGHGGETEMKGILSRLQEFGYLKIERVRDESTGKMGGAVWIVADKPYLWLESPTPQVDYPRMDFKRVENHRHINRESSNTESHKTACVSSQAKPNAAPDGGHRLLACDGKLYLDPVTNEWRRCNDE